MTGLPATDGVGGPRLSRTAPTVAAPARPEALQEATLAATVAAATAASTTAAPTAAPAVSTTAAAAAAGTSTRTAPRTGTALDRRPEPSTKEPRGHREGPERPELSLTAGDARRWAREHRAALVGGDLIALTIAVVVGDLVGMNRPLVLVNAAVLAGWWLALAAAGTYDPRHVGSGSAELLRVVSASARLALVVLVIAYVGRSDDARSLVLVTFPLGIALLVAGRLCTRGVVAAARRRGHGEHRVLAVGTVVDILQLVEQSVQNPGAGFRVVGACVPHYDGPDRRTAGGRRDSISEAPHDQRAGDRRASSDRRASEDRLTEAGVPVVGAPHQILLSVSGSQADTVVIAGQGLLSRHALRRLAWQFEGTGVRLYFTSSLSDVAAPRITLRPLGTLPLLHVEPPAFGGSQRVVKGLADRLLAALLIVVLSPVLVAIALLVRRDSPGPALYRQERSGRRGSTFACLKFRSMRVGADHEVDELQAESDVAGVLFKIRADPRITRVGKVLRRYSLDELPQLFNVLGGSMSLVGPRPPLLSEVAEYGYDVQRRLLVKPGMTGLWQVSGRSDLNWAETVRLDLYYVENWSLYLDLQLMARTVGAVAAGRGAY